MSDLPQVTVPLKVYEIMRHDTDQDNYHVMRRTTEELYLHKETAQALANEWNTAQHPGVKPISIYGYDGPEYTVEEMPINTELPASP